MIIAWNEYTRQMPNNNNNSIIKIIIIIIQPASHPNERNEHELSTENKTTKKDVTTTTTTTHHSVQSNLVMEAELLNFLKFTFFRSSLLFFYFLLFAGITFCLSCEHEFGRISFRWMPFVAFCCCCFFFLGIIVVVVVVFVGTKLAICSRFVCMQRARTRWTWFVWSFFESFI